MENPAERKGPITNYFLFRVAFGLSLPLWLCGYAPARVIAQPLVPVEALHHFDNTMTTQAMGITPTNGTFPFASFAMPAIETEIDVGSVATIQFSGVVTAVSWSPDGLKLATYSDYGSQIDIWQIDGRHLSGWRRSGFDLPYLNNSIGFLDNGFLVTPPNGRTSQSASSALSIWEVANGILAKNIPGPGGTDDWRANVADKFALSVDKSTLAVFTHGVARSVTTYNTHDWTVRLKLLPGATIPASLALSSHGDTLAIGNPTGNITIYDVHTGKPIQEVKAFTAEDYVQNISFSPDDREIVAVAGLQMGLEPPVPTPVRIFSVQDGSLVKALKVDGLRPIRDVVWSPRGDYIAFATDRGARLWSVAVGSVIALEKTAAMAVSFSPNGDAVAVCNSRHVTVFGLPRNVAPAQ